MHTKIINRILEKYDGIFEPGGTTNREYEESGLKYFNYRLWLFEVADSGIYGNMKQVENMKIWDFIEALSYLRCMAKYINLQYERAKK